MFAKIVIFFFFFVAFAQSSSGQYLSFHQGMFVNQYFIDNKKITKRQFNKHLSKNRASKSLYKKSRVQRKYRMVVSFLSIVNSSLLLVEYMRKSIFYKAGWTRLRIYFVTSLGTSLFQAFKQSIENDYYRKAIKAYNLSNIKKRRFN